MHQAQYARTMRFVALLCVLAAMTACAPRATGTSALSLGMSQAQVQENMGPPNAVRGSIRNKHDQVIEVWEYRLYQYAGAIEGLSPFYDLYWLYFADDELVQWGQAGDWEREADRIYEVRFR